MPTFNKIVHIICTLLLVDRRSDRQVNETDNSDDFQIYISLPIANRSDTESVHAGGWKNNRLDPRLRVYRFIHSAWVSI